MEKFAKSGRRFRYRLRRAQHELAPFPQQPEEGGASPAVLNHLKTLHEKTEKELAAMKERLLRAHADMDNLRKRTAKDKEEARNFANENLICALLPILDNFDHAWKAAETTPDFQTFHHGVSLIYQQLMKVLAEAGLDSIEALGQPFDPKFHEAISTDSKEDVPDNQVTDIMRKGYTFKKRVVRPTLVRVNKIAEKAEVSHPSAIRPNPLIQGEPLKPNE